MQRASAFQPDTSVTEARSQIGVLSGHSHFIFTLQIAIRTAKKEAGGLQEIYLFLMGGRTEDPWGDFAAVADAELQPL